MTVLKSLIIFILAAWSEIGGGYLIWQWLKADKPIWYAFIGAILLVIFGFIATCQPGNFGKVYAAYGGIFIAMSVLWGWKIDNIRPDRYDTIGSLLCVIGACIIMYMPRR